jgi:hypothetical protein
MIDDIKKYMDIVREMYLDPDRLSKDMETNVDLVTEVGELYQSLNTDTDYFRNDYSDKMRPISKQYLLHYISSLKDDVNISFTSSDHVYELITVLVNYFSKGIKNTHPIMSDLDLWDYLKK